MSDPNKVNIRKGFIFMDGTEIAETHQCCHCDAHFQIVPGSKHLRGFCRLCMAPICDNPKCMVHMAFEEKLDLYEKGKISSL